MLFQIPLGWLQLKKERDAHRLYTEMGATGHAQRVARELAAAAE